MEYRNIYCSNKCYMNKRSKTQFGSANPNWKGGGVLVICEICDKRFKVIPARANSKRYCSVICAGMASRLERRGENHWHWMGGITTKNQKIRDSFEGRFWKRTVLQRDEYVCQICGNKPTSGTTANHIKRFADFPDIRFEFNNGITLCKSCHILVTHHEPDWESYFNFNLVTRGFLMEEG